jgi:hypothetical protein
VADDLDPFKPVYDRIDKLRELEAQGIVFETCPESRYWRWGVRDYLRLPEEFDSDIDNFGEIRQYW